MAIDLLTEFDPFLSNNLEMYTTTQEKVKHYTYEQFISIMSKQVLNTMIQGVREAQYF